MKEKSSSNTNNNFAQVIENRVVDPISVLHVDDQEIFLQATKIFLEKTTGGKIQVDSLINPEQVFGKLEKKKYDAIVADYIMPSMDGLQLLEQLRNQKNDIPYIILTGKGREEIVIKAMNLGANRYIKKGMDTKSQFSELIHAIEEVVLHVRTYEALQESEKKFRSRIDNLSDIIAEADIEGNFSYLSPQVYDILGYTPEELIGKSGFDHVHPDDMARAQEIVENALKGKAIFNFEYRKKHKDGHYIWASSSGRFDKENKLVFVIRDITDRKKAEETLKESEEILRAFVDGATDAISLWDSELNLIDINRSAIAIFLAGAKKEELIGRNLSKFNLFKERDVYYKYTRVIKTGKPYFVDDFVSQTKIGERYYSIKAFKVGDGMGMIISDITEDKQAEQALQESEARFRTFFHSVTDGIDLWDSDLNLIDCNQAVLDHFPAGSKKDTLIGKNITEVIPDIKETDRYDKYIEVLKTGKPYSQSFASHPKFGGKIFSVQAVKVGDGLGMITSDITGRKQAEDALRESEEKYRSFIENFQGIAFRGFEDFSADFFTGKVEEITGYTEDDFVSGKIVYNQLIHPEDLQRINDDVEEFMASSRRVTQREYRILDKSGKIHWILDYIQKVDDPAGRKAGVYGTLQDITERKQAEEVMITRLKLEQLMARLTSDFVNLPLEEMDQMITNTLKDMAEFAGAVRSSLFLYSEDLQTVTNTHEWCENPENSQIALLQNIPSDSFGYYWELLKQKKNVVMSFKTDLPPEAEGEWEWIGEHGWQSALFVPMVFEGKLYGALGFYGEIGEERQWFDDLVHLLLFVATILTNTFERKKAEKEMLESEERLRNLIDSATDSIALWDSNLNLVDCNNAMLEMLPERTTKEHVIGKNLAEFDPRMKERGEYAQFLEIIQTGKSLVLEGSFSSPKRGRKNYQVNAFKVGDGLGIITTDITERKHAEIALQDSEYQYRNLYENFNRILNSMVDGVYIVNAQHEIEFVNSVLKQEFGSPNGKKCYQYFHDRTESCPWCQNEKVFAGKTVQWEWTSFKNDRTYDLIDTPLRNPDGSVSKLEIFRDITDRKQAEEALRESEEKYRSFVENFQGIAFKGFQDFSAGFILGKVEEITGYTEDEFVSGKVVLTHLIHPEDSTKVNDDIEEFMASSRRSTQREYRILDRGGKVHWILEYIRKIDDPSGKNGGVYGTLQDITERKQAEIKLMESEERLNAFMDAAPDIIQLFDSDLNYIAVNKAAEKELNLSREEIIGKNSLEFYPHLKGTERYNAYKDVIKTGKPLFIDGLKVVSKFGDRCFSVRAFNVGDGLGMITSDITERKQAEEALRESKEKYQMLIEKLEEGVLLEDADGIITFVNPKAMKKLGYSEEEIIGKHWSFTAPPEDLEKYQDETAKRPKGISSTYESGILSKKGERIPVIVSATPLHSPDGEYLGTLSVFRDISDQQKAELELRESEEKYHMLVEKLEEGVLLENAEGIISFVNPKITKLLGYTESELLGKHWTNIVPPEAHDKAKGESLKRLKGISSSYEINLQVKDKSPIPAIVSATPIYSKSDELTGVLSVFTDITKQKQAENALRESEERFRLLGENVAVGLWIIQEDQFVYGNDSFFEIIGFPREEILGSKPSELNKKQVYPEDLAFIQEQFQKKISEEKNGLVPRYQYRWYTKNNLLKWIEVISKPTVYQGKPAILGAIIDITQQKQVERKLIETKTRLEYLLKSNPAVIYTCDTKSPYSITFISENVKEVTGYEPQDYLADPYFMDDRIHPEDKERTLAILDEIPKQDYYLAIYRFQHNDGFYRWMLEEAKLIYDEQGNVLEMIGSWSDITRQKQAEKDVLIINQELKDFATIIAHDLKTPLRNLKTLAGWLLRDSADDLNEEGKDHLASLIKQTTHMDALIGGVYQYSKIDRFQKEIVKINLNDLLSEMIDILSPPDNIKITIQAELPIIVVDRTHITQIFSNLIENAIKFLDKPKGYISINYEDKKSLWQFSVVDNGPGIEESHFERIFQMFQTLSPWDETKGTGIGLAIVKKIVELNGGKIWLESSVGKGSTFYFTLPKIE